MHHYNSTQYCKTETVFSTYPFLQTNITSQMWPCGGKGGRTKAQPCARLAMYIDTSVQWQYHIETPEMPVIQWGRARAYEWAVSCTNACPLSLRSVNYRRWPGWGEMRLCVRASSTSVKCVWKVRLRSAKKCVYNGWNAPVRPCVQYIGEVHLKSASTKCKEMCLQRVKCVHASTATSEMRAN